MRRSRTKNPTLFFILLNCRVSLFVSLRSERRPTILLRWFLDNNILASLNNLDYRLVDEFFRIRILMDGYEDKDALELRLIDEEHFDDGDDISPIEM